MVFYFTSIPYIKEYLATQRNISSKRLDKLIDQVITRVGVRQFETMPIQFLNRSNAPTLRYIIAKKRFRKRKYKQALKTLNFDLESDHPVRPFVFHLQAASYALSGNNKRAIRSYRKCVRASKFQMGRTGQRNRLSQLEINHDSCIVGEARALFAIKKFKKSNLTYLDLDKRSYIWPEILFEEAWNSFYQGDYNRTLGKLVTYRAPLLSFIFNPQTEILKALAYLELCLWSDAKRDGGRIFIRIMKRDAANLRGRLRSYGRDFKKFYMIAKRSLTGASSGNKLLGQDACRIGTRSCLSRTL